MYGSPYLVNCIFIPEHVWKPILSKIVVLSFQNMYGSPYLVNCTFIPEHVWKPIPNKTGISYILKKPNNSNTVNKSQNYSHICISHKTKPMSAVLVWSLYIIRVRWNLSKPNLFGPTFVFRNRPCVRFIQVHKIFVHFM